MKSECRRPVGSEYKYLWPLGERDINIYPRVIWIVKEACEVSTWGHPCHISRWKRNERESTHDSWKAREWGVTEMEDWSMIFLEKARIARVKKNKNCRRIAQIYHYTKISINSFFGFSNTNVSVTYTSGEKIWGEKKYRKRKLNMRIDWILCIYYRCLSASY